MRRDHPPFILGGGEIALLLIGVRIAIWVWRGWRGFEFGPSSPPDGPGPRGKPLRVPAKPAPRVGLRPGRSFTRAA